MKLYYAPGTCALAVHITLEWCGADYEIEKVKPQSASYKKVNPLGMVPALELDDGTILTQADAILKYLAERFPGADLGARNDIMSHYELNNALAFLTGDFHPAFWPFFAPQRYTTSEDKDIIKMAREASADRVARVMEHLDMLLEDGTVACGKRTVADPYAFAMCRWSENFDKSWKDYPNIKPCFELMMRDEGVRAAMSAQGLL